MLQRWAVIYALVVGESDKITKQSHSGFRPQRAIVLGPTPPLLLVSSVSAPYPSAGSNAKEYCRENIAHYKVPEYVDFVEEHPTTASGKIQKYKLREPAAERPSPATVGSA
jgi:acyl-coenzyme A synthetase/AMP-(fatty) acid ligase